MTQHHTLPVKLSNSQLITLKSGKEMVLTGMVLIHNCSSNAVGDSYYKNNFRHKLLLKNTQVLKLRKDFASGSSANIKFSKTQ